jgi:hypothetical protein
MYILFTDRKNKSTNRDMKRERVKEKIVNVVDNVNYVVLNVPVITELLLMAVMVHLISVHDDELLDLL